MLEQIILYVTRSTTGTKLTLKILGRNLRAEVEKLQGAGYDDLHCNVGYARLKTILGESDDHMG